MTKSDFGLEIRNIGKRFGSQTALSNVNLNIRKGEFFSLLGPSGCGKSTLLRIIAGLESMDGGEILWEGRRVDQAPARERPFNMVFQKHALFPHLSVFENVAFGLRLRKISVKEVRDRVKEALDLVNLGDFGERKPETLSGGQSQRVALARAIVNRPACVLLDEPLTALDQKLREYMQTELRLLQKRLGLTFIFVTHDQEEAMLLSDRVAVMSRGCVEQVSEPRELYESPASIFSARFIGRRNELALDLHKSAEGWLELGLNLGARGTFKLRGKAGGCERVSGVAARAFVRPERVKILSAQAATTPEHNVLEGEIVQIQFRGVRAEIIVALTESLFLRVFDEGGSVAREVGEKVRV